MVKSNVEKHTINWAFKNAQRGLLDFTIAIQRKEVWDLAHMSNLIIAILLGVPVESVLFEEDSEDGYLVLDGKQRLTTLIKYLRNEFAIAETVKVQEIDGLHIVGKKFDELPGELQDTLKEYELSISVLRPLTEEEREMIFFMRNQAIPLTKVELTRVALGSKYMELIESLGKHSFLSKTNLSSAGLNRYQDQQIVLECLLLDTGKELGFSGKNINAFAEIIREEGISKEQQETVIKTFDYLDRAIPKKCSHLRKIHIPMVYKTAQIALDNNVPEEKFYDWMIGFFKYLKITLDGEYAEAVNSRSAELSNVKKRIRYIVKHYEENIGRM